MSFDMALFFCEPAVAGHQPGTYRNGSVVNQPVFSMATDLPLGSPVSSLPIPTIMRIRIYSLLITFLVAAMTCHAQTFQHCITWPGGDAAALALETDTGYIVCGTTTTGVDYDFHVVHFEEGSDTLWTHRYGGESDEHCYGMLKTSDGGYLLNGSTRSFKVSNQDLYLVRTTGSGNVLWSKTYGGSEFEVPGSIAPADDGYIISGSTNSLGAGANDVLLIRIDADGDTMWTRTFGGPFDEIASNVVSLEDGGFAVCGYTSSFGAGSNDLFILRTDENGDLLWSKTYGGPYADETAWISSTDDGGFILSGWTWSFGIGGKNILLVKTDANGNTEWSMKYDNGLDEIPWQVRQTSDSGYIVATSSYIMKTNSSGAPQWLQRYGSDSEAINSVNLTDNGGLLLAGYALSFSVDYDMYIVLTTADGTSGCFETEEVNTSETVTTVLSAFSPVVSGGLTMHEVNTLVSSGGTLNTVCAWNGIAETMATSLSLYPNPGGRQFTITLPGEQDADLRIFNGSGQLAWSTHLKSLEKATIHPKLSPGVYFVSVHNSHGVWCEKVLVE
jgi:hypothetical protein